MITTKTVLILGAGASMDFGFPSGDELAYEIYRDGPNHLIAEDFARKNGFDLPTVESFKKALSISQLSVDAFLENREDEDFYDIGKAAIAWILLRCEWPNRLFIGKPPYHHFEDMRGTNHRTPNWYKLLWNRLVELPREESYQEASSQLFDRFSDNQLSVVTFNYDRSLEYFLTFALQSATGRDTAECADKILSVIPVIHVYGSLGPLFGEKNVPYGDVERIYHSWPNIDLVRQGEVKDTFNHAHRLLSKAERIVFLGFGFDRTNYIRLRLDSEVRAFQHPCLHGTAMRLPAILIERLNQIKGIGNLRAFYNLFDITIYDYLYRANSQFELNKPEQELRIIKHL